MSRRGRSRGLAVVEFAMVLPILLVVLFGIIDLGRMILTYQVLINVSREAANLAARGTPLVDAITAVSLSAPPLDLAADGYVVITEVVRDVNGRATIKAQQGSGGAPSPSRIGNGIGSVPVLPATNPLVPPNGGTMYVAEVFYESAPITPVGALIGITLSDIYYDVAFF
ncbi:MAG: pilus assembly protein [Pseudomonadota bacterium]|nr:pilus assembly protein [Pseudomonadota bacterium]